MSVGAAGGVRISRIQIQTQTQYSTAISRERDEERERARGVECSGVRNRTAIEIEYGVAIEQQ